ncbi:MAG: tRNA lysidine(34) synthetase TilS [Bacilli bacterium]|nr:tRNA lysidine(34) synthetase TilS [Bacilli bacterium]
MPDKFNEVHKFINENIRKDDTLILAISGGPDSMCLLDLIIKYREKVNINIIVAHVHHNVREESDQELIFVEEYSKKNNLIFETMKIEKYEKDNFESEARDKRYEFFDKLQKKYKANYLLTAHHGDDLMETILMRMVRGASLKGYSGFEQILKNDNYSILRPLITVTKEDIIKYNKLNKVPYVNDYTNDLDIHTRNRYRKYILPKLKEEDENVHLKFLKYSNLLIKYNNFVDEEAKKALKKVYVNNTLNISKFIKYDEIIRVRIINFILSTIYNDDIVCVDDKNVSDIHNLILSNKSNSKINLPKNKVAIKSYNEFYIIDNKEKDNYSYLFDKKIVLPNGKTIEKVEREESNSNYVCRLSTKDIKLPIIIRTKQEGDIITVMNMKGHKKVKEIFINAKIPMVDRNTWPIVTDSDNNILWIPGIKKTKYNKQNDEKYDIILKYY